jgi:hypothetical protein
MFTLGFTGAIGNIEFGTYLVANVADDMIARVTAIGQALAIGACALGSVLGGYDIQRFGVKGAIEILLVIVVALAFFSLFMPEVAKKIEPVFRPIHRIFMHARLQTILTTTPCETEGDDLADVSGKTPNPASRGLGQGRDKQIRVRSGKPGGFTWAKNSRP